MTNAMPVATSSSLDPEYLLSAPNGDIHSSPAREPRRRAAVLDRFVLKSAEKTYAQQYAGLYFLRLAVLKPRVTKVAREAWQDMTILNQTVKQVDRVLDVRHGEFCWAVGTVYMEMALKPNILNEVTKEFWTTVPVSADKFADPAHDAIMLEDESGRLNLVGSALRQQFIVTGCVIAVLGSETADGDFDVIDVRFPELAPQVPLPLAASKHDHRFIALVSGLEVSGGVHESYETTMLVEYLMGELGGSKDAGHAAEIVHVIIAGDAFGDSHAGVDDAARVKKKYGYDAGAYNPKPTEAVDRILAELCFSVTVDIMPGHSDPTNVTLPQQALHPALVPKARTFLNSTFQTVTNPCWWDADGLRILGTSGQPIDDIFKYVDGDDRLKMMESTLRWQHCAPTAPDTLWSYPFRDEDPFILDETPHLYFAGNQPCFSTSVVHGSDGQRARLVTVPKFSETSEIVLVNVDTLECEVVKFGVAR